MIKAVMDRIFVRIQPQNKSAGGILLTQEDAPTHGVVESVGPMVQCVKPGDEVLFYKWEELPTYDPNVIVIRQASLLGIYENE